MTNRRLERPTLKIPSRDNKKRMKVLIGTNAISEKVQSIAERISDDYEDRSTALICVEYGGKAFYNLLIDNLHSLGFANFFQGSVKVEVGATKKSEDRSDSIFHFESGIASDRRKLKGLHVLLIDDQFSRGRTFDFLRERYSNALSVSLAALLVKDRAKSRIQDARYHGFLVKTNPNESLVGFGMDYREDYRDLRYISRIRKEGEVLQ